MSSFLENPDRSASLASDRARDTAAPERIQHNCAFWRRGSGRIQDWSADSRVRAFLAPDQVRADKAVRAPISPFLESALGASLDCGDMCPLFLHPRQRESGREFKRSRGQLVL